MPFDGALNEVRLVVVRKPFSTTREIFDLAHEDGKTLGYYMDDTALDVPPGCTVNVQVVRGATPATLRPTVVPLDQWDSYAMQPGDTVSVVVLPGKGGGKNPFRLLLSIAAFAFSFAGGPFLGATLFSLGGFSLTVGQAIGFGLQLIGGLFASTPKAPKPAAPDAQVYSITGTRNALDPFGAVPRLYGKHRIWPKLGAKPYTEIVGNDQYLNLLFNLGYAPMKVSEMKIGETLLSDYQGVEIEMRGTFGDFGGGQSLRLSDGGSGPGMLTVPAASIDPMEGGSFTVEFRLTLYDGGSTGVRRDLVHKGSVAGDCTFTAHLMQGHATRLGIAIGDGSTLHTVEGPDLEIGRAYHVALRWAKPGDLETDGQSASVPRRRPIGLASGAMRRDDGSVREPAPRPPKKPKAAKAATPARLALFVDEWRFDESDDLPGSPVWDNDEPFEIVADDGTDFAIDEVRLWHTPRADDHIEMYAGMAATGDEPNLTALFDFDHADARDTSARRIAPGTLSGTYSFEEGQISSAAPMTLFRNDVDEEQLSVKLTEADSWVTRTTALGVDEIGVDVQFPQGLVLFSGSGKKKPTTVEIEVQYRRTGTETWLNPVWVHQGQSGFEHLVAGSPAKMVVTDSKAALVRRGGVFRPPVGEQIGDRQYDVRLRRITEDNLDDSNLANDVQWTALRSVTFTDPISMPDVVKIALRIRASEQLQNVIDQFNVIAEAYLAVWDATAERYRLQLTRDAAWAYVDALAGPAATEPIGYDRIDTPAFAAWAADNETAGRHFDFYVRDTTTTFDVLTTIAAAGRGKFSMYENRYSIARDVPQSVPVQQFTPHNSFDFKGQHIYLDRPHALVVSFINAEKGYKPDERIVYMDGWDASTASEFERIQIDGIVETEIAYREATYRAAASILRPENYSWGCDAEHLVCAIGDLVNVVHFTASWGLSSGRVKSATVDAVTVDALVPMEAGKSYGIRFRYADKTFKDVLLAPSTIDAEFAVLAFAAPILEDDLPEAGDLFATGEAGYIGEDLIVTRIAPAGGHKARIYAAPAAPQIHDLDNQPVPPWTSHLTVVPTVHLRPSTPVILDVRSDESVLERLPNGDLRARMLVSVAPAPPVGETLPAAELEAEYRPAGGSDWVRAPKVIAGETTIELAPVEDGTEYELRVRALSRLGVASAWASTLHTVIGQTSLPPAPAGLLVERLPNGMRRYRIPPYTMPVDHAGWHFRWRAGEALPQWSSGIAAHAGLWTTDSFEAAAFADRSYVVMVKGVDRGGRESDGFAYAIVDLGDPVYDAVEEAFDERAAGWPGERTGCIVSAGDLVADSAALLFDSPSEPLFEDPDDPLFGGFGAMTYKTAWTPTLPGYLNLEWAANKSATVEYQRPGGELLIVNPNTALIADPDAPLLRDAIWLPFQGPFGVVPSIAVKARFQLGGGASQGRFTAMRAVVEAETEIEHLNDVEIAAAGTRLPIAKPFTRILGVSLTLQDDAMLDAVTARRLDLDADLGPLVKCFDASNVATDGLVDATVRGVV